MSRSFSTLFVAMVVRWVTLAGGMKWVVLGGAVAATTIVGAYFATHVAINTDTSDMLSSELPFRRDLREITAAFPKDSSSIVVVVDASSPDGADAAATELGKYMGSRPAIFGQVFDAAGDMYFRRNGLLYLSEAEISQLGDRLSVAQPLIGTLAADQSLRGLFNVLSLAIEEALKGGESLAEIDNVLDAMAAVVEAQGDGRFANLSWRELMQGAASDGGVSRRLIVVRPPLDFGSLRPAGDAMDSIRTAVMELGLSEKFGARVRLTGSAALAAEEIQSVGDGMGLAGIISLTVVAALLLVGLRSMRMALSVFVTLVMGLIWTAGFAAAAVGTFNLISVAFAVLFIGLSVDFGIHFALRYREAIDSGASHDQALREAAAGVGGALTLCAAAAALGFFSFLPTDYVGLAELGLIAGVGMFIALAANLTVLPALLGVMPPKARDGNANSAGFSLVPRVRRHARPVVWTSLGLAVAAAVVASQARFDFDPLALRDPGTESVATLFDLMADESESRYTIAILADSLADADLLAKKLADLPEVARATTLSNYVPTDQDEKIYQISDLAFLLQPSLAAVTDDSAPDERARAVSYETLHRNLVRLTSEAGKQWPGAGRLKAAFGATLGNTPNVGALSELESRLLAYLPAQLESLRLALEANDVGLEDVPVFLRERMLAADGRAIVEAVPRERLYGDQEAIARFVGAVRTVAPNATGAPVTILEAGQAVVGAFAEAATLSVVAIAVLLVVVVRNARDAILIFVPLVFAALLTVAISGLFDLPFNFANIIVLPLLFGLGVANGIHLVMRHRENASGTDSDGSTPRAVVFSALTTIGSFASIAMSSHPGTASMGVLLTIAISLTLLCTLIVLPALMETLPGGQPRRG